MIFYNVVAPSLPLPTKEYDVSQQDQYANALRIYFNTLDRAINALNKLVEQGGGSNLSFPHIAASDNTDQYATGDNIPTLVRWDTLDYGYGFTLNIDGSATANFSGVYKIDYSLQFANTDNAQHDVDVWLNIDNVNVVGSTSKFSLQQRKSAGVYTFLVAYSSVMFSVTAGQSFRLYWATGKAYNPVGPVNGVYMEYQPAQTVPFAHPSVPSAIGSITFVSHTTT